MILKGFRFGILLQFAVGPVCLYLFQTAVSSGLQTALTGVIGVALADGLYIALAIFGLGTLIRKNTRLHNSFQRFGGSIVLLFGLSTLLGAFGISILPSLHLQTAGIQNMFVKALLLTLSNPMTILFWTGVFSAKIAEDKLNQQALLAFGLGAVFSTLVFLSSVSFLGSQIAGFLTPSLLLVFNAAVGIILMGFGLKILIASTATKKRNRPIKTVSRE